MQWFYFRSAIYYEVCTIVVTEGLSMCLVMKNPVDILTVRHVKQGIEAGGFRRTSFKLLFVSFLPKHCSDSRYIKYGKY